MHTPRPLHKQLAKHIREGIRHIRRLARGNSSHKYFVSWWNKYRSTPSLPEDLVLMVDNFIVSPDCNKLTYFWHLLNKKNIAEIATEGLANYRQTVAKNYFTFVDQTIESDYSSHILENARLSNTQISISQVLKKHDLFTLDESIQHNLVTVMLYDYVSSIGGAEPLKLIKESAVGNPPSIEINGKQVSHDILNSVIEYISISSGAKLGDSPRIMEIGAGSGRTAYALLTLIPNAKYVIADVPPALYVSQYFLSTQFPGKKIFRFRPFNNYAEIREEFEAADIAFLMPHQLDLINTSIDLFLAIDCLHEMNKQQVDFYFQQAGRLAKHFYFKCWSKTEILVDRISWGQSDYPVKQTWEEVFWRSIPFPSNFFEAFINIR